MKFILTLTLTILISNCFKVNAQQKIKIGLYRNSVISIIEIKSNDEIIKVKADNTFFSLPINSKLLISAKMNGVSLYIGDFNLGQFKQIEIEMSENAGMSLKPIAPDYPENKYCEMILISAKQNKLSIINKLTMVNYIVGVLRGEIGYDKPFNSYMVMAILAQTYAEGNYSRHRTENFNLCDQTHCQVFKGYFKYEPYHQAAELAKNKIVLDANGYIIEGLFHSNCGGKTQNSGEVWRNDLSYCKSVNDSFCLIQKNSKWTKSISIYDFCLKLNIPYSASQTADFSFCNNIQLKNDAREKEIFICKKTFNTIFIRTQLNLKSDWFDLSCTGDSVLISGKGFGHGVGLCQEGAIEMAKQGCNEEEIIYYYFKNVLINERRKIPFNN
jgi:stage II sporulation protein D